MTNTAKKINLIIDSDTGNEIDDAFALTYAFANQDRLNIRAITIAPFSDKERHITARDSIIESALEANRILRYIGVKNPSLVYKGSEGFVSNLYNKTSPAVEKIIEVAREEEVTIACLGGLTNVAIAISKAPEIINKIKIVWLGTRHVFYQEFDDLNYKTDKKAFETVLKSGALFTVIPSYVGKFIVTSKHEFEKNVAVNDVGRYLLKKIKSDMVNLSDLGIKTLYDLAPLAYIVNPSWFMTKAISANRLLKEQPKISMGILINYVYDMKSNQIVWRDFVEKVTKYGNNVSPARIYFTSDTHFDNIQNFRLNATPFKSLQEYNDELVARWNRIVSDEDTVYHLGDFGDYEFVKKLKGKIILICGNHEQKDFRKKFEKFKNHLIDLGFKDVIIENAILKEEGVNKDIFLIHKPSNCSDEYYNLYGHVHDLKPLKKNGFNVCTTYHDFTPVSMEEIKKYINFLTKYADEEVFTD